MHSFKRIFFILGYLLYKINIKDKIHSIKTQIINQARIQRFNRFDAAYAFNFELDSVHKDYLYSIFLEESKKIFGNFTLVDENLFAHIYSIGTITIVSQYVPKSGGFLSLFLDSLSFSFLSRLLSPRSPFSLPLSPWLCLCVP